MLDIIQEYWRNYLWTDGFQITGVAMTLWLLVVSLLAGFILSLPLAIARSSLKPWLRTPVWLFTYIFRGTPLYIQLLIFYTGVYHLDFVRSSGFLSGIFREGIYCAILAFVLSTCAYTTEIFAGAIRSMPHGEIEAAHAYGMSGFKTYCRIILPSILRRSLPAYSNEVILMLHSTSVAFTATVPDILKIARDVNADTYQPFAAFGIAAVLYATITFFLVFGFRRLESHFLRFQRRKA